jgi:hypothetical protein
MGRTVNGVSSILVGTRLICRMVGRFGTAALETATTPELAAAVIVLVGACQAFEALDDYPGERDRTEGELPEDDAGA